jgi:hypothetical protein
MMPAIPGSSLKIVDTEDLFRLPMELLNWPPLVSVQRQSIQRPIINAPAQPRFELTVTLLEKQPSCFLCNCTPLRIFQHTYSLPSKLCRQVTLGSFSPSQVCPSAFLVFVVDLFCQFPRRSAYPSAEIQSSGRYSSIPSGHVSWFAL